MTSLGLLEIIMIATSTLLFILLCLAIYLYASSRSKIKTLSLDKAILMVEFADLLQKNQPDTVEQTDGFLKFVSESRDWAFTYIEDVQAAIEEYRRIADVVPLSKDMTVEQAELLSSAYDKLMSFLPDENLI